MTKSDELVFLPLGGSGEIGMNLNLYGYGREHARKWIMIDCGVMFGNERTPGIELICPDPEYIVEHKRDLLGLFLTHGHEDHIGAVALMWPMLGCPIYATAFTAELVRRKLEERGVTDAPLHVVEEGARLNAGPFDLEYVTLTHSIPEPNGIILRTPLGTVLHTGDWKLDADPSLGPVADETTLTKLGDDGLLAMVCDSTNVLTEGESGAEMRVRESLIDLIARQPGRVAVTTFASNVGRLFSVCEAARAAGRNICLMGRSMLRMIAVAQETGLLDKDMPFVEPGEANHLPKDKILYLCTGSQGEPRAALSRIAREDHQDVTLSEGDTVIFSSKIIPGNEREIYDMQNQLVELGVKVITEKDAFVHVSGHPCRDELRQMYAWARPRYAIPVHGEARHLEEHATFARELGAEASLSPRNGDLIRLAPGEPEIIDEVPSGRLHLDGMILVPEGAEPLRMRRRLAFAGVISVSLLLDERGALIAPAEVTTVGAPRETAGGEALDVLIAEEVEAAVDGLARARRNEDEAVVQAGRRAVRGVLQAVWGKRAEIIIHVLRAD